MKTVIRLENNIVMVFDDSGEQMPRYQGQYEQVKKRILTDASPETVFNHWYGRSVEPRQVPVEDW